MSIDSSFKIWRSCLDEFEDGMKVEVKGPEREIEIGVKSEVDVEVEDLEGGERVRFRDEDRKDSSKDVGSDRRCLL